MGRGAGKGGEAAAWMMAKQHQGLDLAVENSAPVSYSLEVRF